MCASGEIWGGVEQCLVTLANGLRRRGVSVEAMLFYDARLADRLRSVAVPVRIVPSSSVHDLAQVTSVKRILREDTIDVVHAHGYRATVTAAAACARSPNVALVKTEHGQLERPATWKQLPTFLRLAANVALDRALTRARVDEVVYVSGDIRDGTASWCGHGPVIHNGIDPDEVRRQAGRPTRSPDAFHVGIVGRLTAVKGHADLFRALSQTPRSVVLKVFGTGPDEPELRRLAAQLGVDDRVEFKGFVNAIYPELASLDLLAMPSLHEGLPYTLLEAMSLGVPVVATRVGGLPEALDDGVTGVLVPARDPGLFACAIRELQADPARRIAMAERAQDAVATLFHVDHMVGQYMEVYSRAVVDRC